MASPSIVTVIEHTAIAIDNASYADALDALNERLYRKNGFRPLSIGRNTIKPRHYVGILSYGRNALEILPKTDDTEDLNARTHLLTMLAATRRLPIHESETYKLQTQSRHLLDVFIRIFCRKLYKEVHRGLIHRYEAESENIRVCKGKLYMPEHIQKNTAHQERFYCQYDSFRIDNQPNRILKAALRAVEDVPQSNSTQQMIQELRFTFDEVSDVMITRTYFDSLIGDRTIARYADALRMAGLFLFGQSPDVSIGGFKCVTLLFDMNKLFEEYGSSAESVDDFRFWQLAKCVI